ncbi:MAG: class I SAM-dependent methyltransferase [Verrucomicrobia bacterium]|nr:class I SAM-dependent methyltransferase [Verrucomicrobiota bacterium]
MELFAHFDPKLPVNPATRDFFQFVDVMIAQGQENRHPAFLQYTVVCRWAIRKLEYGFVTQAFANLDADHTPLRVLDVGCGVVPLCNWMSCRGHEVVALDPLAETIQFLSINGLNQKYGSDVSYLHGRCELLPFSDASFDVITCVSVLEHMVPGNDRLALREMARVLKPGARLIITFDVAPRRDLHVGEDPWPSELRRYEEPFEPESLLQLLRELMSWFDDCPTEAPQSFMDLTWDQLHNFWSASQEHDGRETAHREYLAIGAVLTRNQTPVSSSSSDSLTPCLEGQATLIERVAFYQKMAAERLSKLQKVQQIAYERADLIKQLKSQAKLTSQLPFGKTAP